MKLKKILSRLLYGLLTVFLMVQTNLTIIAQIGQDGIAAIEYTVKKGESWNSIAKKFGVTYAELRLANKNENDKLNPGKIILIPGSRPKANDPFYKKNYLDSKKPQPSERKPKKFHTVQKGQTLYSISKMYGIAVEDLKKWNSLSSNNIEIGQRLIVSGEKTSEEKKPEPPPAEKKQSDESKPDGSQIKTEEVKPETQTQKPETSVEDMVGTTEAPKEDVQPPLPTDNDILFADNRKEMKESGTVLCMEGDGGTEKYYALHRTAPVGTIIRVLNLANSRKIFVKVTGQLTGNDDDVILKISKAGAEKLGVSSASFKANLLYGVNKE